jgi:hypothetical protein
VALVEDCVLELWLVSTKIMMALESISSKNINFRINVAGMENLSADNLQR